MTGYPVWDIKVYLHASTEQEVPIHSAHAELRVLIYDDNQWTIVVERADRSFNLLLRGDHQSKSVAMMRDVFGWTFGRAA